MDTLIHADIFFFVTTIVVIILGLTLVIAAFFVIKILSNVSKISDTIRDESGLLAEDVHVIRTKVREGNLNLTGIFRLFRDLFAKKKRVR